MKVGLPGGRLEASDHGGEDGGGVSAAGEETRDHVHDDR